MRITLKAARVNAGYTQETASIKMGVSRQTISNWEKGKVQPRLSHIPIIEEVYGCNYDNIIFLPRNHA